jgi:hypothetical protein
MLTLAFAKSAPSQAQNQLFEIIRDLSVDLLAIHIFI